MYTVTDSDVQESFNVMSDDSDSDAYCKYDDSFGKKMSCSKFSTCSDSEYDLLLIDRKKSDAYCKYDDSFGKKMPCSKFSTCSDSEYDLLLIDRKKSARFACVFIYVLFV